MRIAVIDTETTGLDPQTCDVIEIAFAVGEFDDTGKLTLIEAISTVLPCTQNDAEAINGITPELSSKGTVEHYAIAKSLLAVDFFVAHNASFDKGFFDKSLTQIPDANERLALSSKRWVCTLNDYEIADKAGRRLTHMAADMGIFMSASKHRALVDVMVLFEVVSKLGEAAFVQAFKRSLWPEWRVQAMVSFEDKHLAKEAGFQWEPNKKMWLKNVKAEDRESLDSMFNFSIQHRRL